MRKCKCEHWQSCPECTSALRLAQIEIQRLRQTLRDLMDLAEHWFIREGRRNMSESEYRNWHSMSFGSKAYQDAKQAALAAKEERCRQRNR